jgi:hypothetical protein
MSLAVKAIVAILVVTYDLWIRFSLDCHWPRREGTTDDLP